MLAQLKEEVIGAREHTESLVQTNLTHLISTLKTPANSITPPTTATPDNMKTQILEIENTIQGLLEEGLRITTKLFPTKAPFSQQKGENRIRFWPKTIKRDVLTLRNRAILLKCFARLNLSDTLIHQDPHITNHAIDDDNNHIINILTTPPNLETKLHTPLWANITLYLPTLTPNTTHTTNTIEGEAILTCYKAHQVAKIGRAHV